MGHGKGVECAERAQFPAGLRDSAPSCAEPMCSMFRDPRREDHTICTAAAPNAVFTVRTYATRRDYELRGTPAP